MNSKYCTVIQQQIVADPTSRFLKFRRPDLYTQIDRSKYTIEDFIWIDKLTYGSKVKLWWICILNPCGCHKWEATIKNRMVSKLGCPVCYGTGSATKVCIHKSFMINSQLASEYAWDLNPDINPWEISYGSNIEIWFRCTIHKTCKSHIWKSMIYNRSNERDCPFCSIPCKQVCLCNSFMNNPQLAYEFDQQLNININPYEISSGSNHILIWKCQNHKSCDLHIWSAMVSTRSNGAGCPFCVNRYVCPCNTFMNNPLLTLLKDEFDQKINNDIDPYKLSSGSNEYVWWKCSTCLFLWQSTIYNRSNGNGCPKCASLKSESKGEERCRSYLESINIQYYSQIKFYPIPRKRYDFGFIKDDKRILIEIDGIQHFKFTEIFHKIYTKFYYHQRVDKIKTFISIMLDINILRISNDNEQNIHMCINRMIEVVDFFSKYGKNIIAFDDITKYSHIVNYLNFDVITEICDEKFHEDVFDNFLEREIYFYDIKTNQYYIKIFDLEYIPSI